MKKLSLILAGLICLGVTCLPSKARADVNDFTITNFVAYETLSRADPQGELHVTEHISLVFTDYNHGILRAIPKSYKKHSLQMQVNQITSASGAPTQYTTYSSNGNTVLKIGDPNRTITGSQEYTIDYTLHNVITFYDDHDELYWDVNGDQWQQPFEHVAVSLELPSNLRQTREPVCYAGGYGQTLHNCTISNKDNTIQSEATQPLSANQTLTYVAGFEKGYFQPSTWHDTLSEYLGTILKLTVIPLLAFAYAFQRWLKLGRDAKGRGVIIPEYQPPDNLKPLDVGALLDFRADNKDITATIIDLAIRGYIKIIETKQSKRLRKDTLSYQLELTKADFAELSADESALLKALFTQQNVGETVAIDKAKSSLYNAASTLRKDVMERLAADGYFRANPLKAGRRLYLLAGLIFVIICVMGAVLGWALIVGCVVALMILLGFGVMMPARSEKGIAALEHVAGLRLYLNVAEKDRLKKLQGPDAQYAAQAGEPVKTVELFEKLLPYAMVLGVEQEWAKQFEGLYTSPPDWYSGNWSTFNTGYLVGSLNDGIGSAVNTAFTSPSSSGGSGFSGGGGSGGGGGGGGGGGW